MLLILHVFLYDMRVHMYGSLWECGSPVFLRLVERILERRLPRRSNDKDVVLVTIFQLWSYLEVEGIKDLNAHVSELAEEGGWTYRVHMYTFRLTHSTCTHRIYLPDTRYTYASSNQ